MFIKDVPLNEIKVGDKTISLTGKQGVIAGIYDSTIPDPFGKIWDDWGGAILILWMVPNGHPRYSLVGYFDLKLPFIKNQ